MTEGVHAFTGPGVDGDEPDTRPTLLADSPFAALLESMRQPLPNEQFAIRHPKRSSVEVILRSNVSLDELNVWRKEAADESFPSGIDMARLACVLIANASLDVAYDGRRTGRTLHDPEILALYPDAPDVYEATRRFFDNEELWLATRAMPALTTAWSGGEQDGDVLRPTTTDQ